MTEEPARPEEPHLERATRPPALPPEAEEGAQAGTPFALRYEQAVKAGVTYALLAGFLSSSFCVILIVHDFWRMKAMMILGASAIIGATVSMPLFWRWLTPGRDGLAMWRGAAAGACSALIASVAMWPGVVFYFFGDALDIRENFFDAIIGSLRVSLFFGIMSVLLTGVITVPVGVAAACLATWRARRVLERDL